MQYDLNPGRSIGCPYQNLFAFKSPGRRSDMGWNERQIANRGRYSIFTPGGRVKACPDARFSPFRGTSYIYNAGGLRGWSALWFESARDRIRTGKLAPYAGENESAPGSRGSNTA